MWIHTKTGIDGRWIGTICYFIKQHGRWIGTIYCGGHVDYYHIEQNFERFISI